jgi:ribosomal protein L11 methyltransferase
LAADLLWRAGASAVVERALPDAGDRDAPAAPVELVADIDPDAVGALESALAALAGHPVQLRFPEDAERADAWQAHARPVRSGRFVVRPVGAPDDGLEGCGPGDVVLTVDAGEAFGSGAHPSTRGCLLAVDQWVRAGDTVLDVGSGSGVLSVAAVAAGARRCVAVDVEPAARAATAATAARHGYTDLVVVAGAEVPDAVAELGGGVADVVLANLLLPVIESIGAALVARTAPGGTLVIGGLLTEQEDRARHALPITEPVERIELDGWVTLVLRR